MPLSCQDGDRAAWHHAIPGAVRRPRGRAADSGLHAQIDVACTAAGFARRTVCEAQNMQYLTELVQHGLGISVLPPMSLRAVVAARCPPTEPHKPCSTSLPPTSAAGAAKPRSGPSFPAWCALAPMAEGTIEGEH